MLAACIDFAHLLVLRGPAPRARSATPRFTEFRSEVARHCGMACWLIDCGMSWFPARQFDRLVLDIMRLVINASCRQ
jgi:hypothetical protein